MGEASSLRAEGGDASSRAADASCILEFLGTGNMRKGARSPHDQGAVSTERLWINARLFIGSWSSGDQQNYITSRYGFKSRVEKDLSRCFDRASGEFDSPARPDLDPLLDYPG